MLDLLDGCSIAWYSCSSLLERYGLERGARSAWFYGDFYFCLLIDAWLLCCATTTTPADDNNNNTIIIGQARDEDIKQVKAQTRSTLPFGHCIRSISTLRKHTYVLLNML